MIYDEDGTSVKIKELDWDSSVLGLKCGYLDLPVNQRADADDKKLRCLLEAKLEEAKRNDFKFLTVKVPTENKYMLKCCTDNRGTIIDTELTFIKRGKRGPYKGEALPNGILIKKFETYWNDELYELAQALEISRFSLDNNIERNSSLKLWRQSIYNNCNGRATYSIICFHNGKPVGLMSLFEKEDVSNIFFIAVLPEYQNRGLGRHMIRFYEENLSPSIKEQTVETLSLNCRAQKLYIEMGYEKSTSKHILHFWL
jgi:ribosomal protein S18 acetylase RimI-like enzyme